VIHIITKVNIITRKSSGNHQSKKSREKGEGEKEEKTPKFIWLSNSYICSLYKHLDGGLW
jgi:hypothetical protein